MILKNSEVIKSGFDVDKLSLNIKTTTFLDFGNQKERGGDVELKS